MDTSPAHSSITSTFATPTHTHLISTTHNTHSRPRHFHPTQHHSCGTSTPHKIHTHPCRFHPTEHPLTLASLPPHTTPTHPRHFHIHNIHTPTSIPPPTHTRRYYSPLGRGDRTVTLLLAGGFDEQNFAITLLVAVSVHQIPSQGIHLSAFLRVLSFCSINKTVSSPSSSFIYFRFSNMIFEEWKWN